MLGITLGYFIAALIEPNLQRKIDMDHIENVRDNATGRYTNADRAKSEPESVTVEHDKRHSPFIRELIRRGERFEEAGFAPDEGFNVVTWLVNGPTQ